MLTTGSSCGLASMSKKKWNDVVAKALTCPSTNISVSFHGHSISAVSLPAYPYLTIVAALQLESLMCATGGPVQISHRCDL
eukprot:4951426-Amphidinium_carterae.2